MKLVQHLLRKLVLLGLCRQVIFIEGLLEHSREEPKFLCKCFARVKPLHVPAPHIMLAMPFNFFARLTIENKPNWELAVFPDFSSYKVTVLKFVDKALAFIVEKETADTAKSFSSK